TFDSDTEAPLFVKCSFVQPPPKIDGANEDLSWHFVKVRYRRVLCKEALDQSLVNGNAVSAWTEPVWAQFLPPSNRVLVQQGDLIDSADVQDLHYNPTDGGIRRGSDIVSPRATKPADKSKAGFQIYALRTLLVSDALGRQNQEAFHDMTLLDDSTTG